MPSVRGITVSVGQWYADLLRITLPRNMRHLTACVVVTAPGDPAIAVARAVPDVTVFETDGFTRPDVKGVRPRFNKGICIEECFSFMGRDGLIAIWDADCLWADCFPLDRLRPGRLYGARRRVLENPADWHPGLDWRACPVWKDGGPVGHTQLFDAADPALAGKRPWYDVSFAHAGGGDAYFMAHWPRHLWATLPGEVLHLGPPDRHWFGTDPGAVDTMAAFVTRNGWTKAAARHDPAADGRVGAIVERVEIPGYPPSTYELPFVRRAKGAGT